MIIKKRYLAIPCNENISLKSCEFYRDGKLIADRQISVDRYYFDKYVYLDMKDHVGASVKGICKFSDDQLDLFEEGYVQQLDSLPKLTPKDNRYRPFIHYTARRGWLSDPNGCLFFDGKFHLFYQYNPLGVHRDMHWGHAISDDLLHWEEQQIALYPDENGNIFSGSGVSKEDDIYLFYTAAGGTSEMSRGRDFTICLAISENGGEDFTCYKNNPVVLNISPKNRDPRVVYVSELKAYVMVLYITDVKYAFLISDNLISWRLMQYFELKGNNECPDLYKLYLDDDPHKPYWILSGASDRYCIGQFEIKNKETSFLPCQTIKKLHYGNLSYAAQSFTGTGKNRVFRMSWLQSCIPDSPFNGQMSVPQQMKLKSINNEMFLCASPIDKLEQYRADAKSFENISVAPGQSFSCDAAIYADRAFDMELKCNWDKDNVLTVNLFGLRIICDMEKNQLTCNSVTSPLSVSRKEMKIRVILDKLSVEIFVDEGEFFVSAPEFCDYNSRIFRLESRKEAVVGNLNISSIVL